MKTENTHYRQRIPSFVYALVYLAELLTVIMLLKGCTDTCVLRTTYTYYEPVYTPLTELRQSVITEPAQPINQVGRIYYKSGYLFINDPGKGMHVVDNRDPARPVKKSFISIPGNMNMAVKNNTLYADSYIDLVLLDIADPDDVKEIDRIENVFSSYNSLGFYVDPVQGVVTDWVEKREVNLNDSDCASLIEPWGGVFFEGGIAMRSDAATVMPAAAAPVGNSTGTGGSMAQFTIANDYLYMMDGGELKPADISDEHNPVLKDPLYLSWDVETIFPREDNLFLGSRSGMYIMDISNPATPAQLSFYGHIQSCDPVVVDGDYAYVTLRSGTPCEGFSNQLEIINISSLLNPYLEKTYTMHNPHGLGIDNNVLFICDGDAGLKVYNADDPLNLVQVAHYTEINTYDIIPIDNVAMLIGSDGLFQYDYTNPLSIELLSHIPVTGDVE